MTAGRVVTFTSKEYKKNEFIDLYSAPSDEYLRGDGTWQTAAFIVGSGLTLAAMDDVNVTSIADNDFLTYDSASSKWINEPLPIPPGLSSTSDVNFNALTLTGNLTVQGVTTTVDSSTMTVVDPIITLQTASGGGALAADSNKDVGIAMQYHTGSAAKTAFLGFDDSETKLTFVPDATITSEVVSGTKGTIVANLEGNVTGNADTVTNGLYTTDLGVTVQSYDAELAAIAGLTSAADKGIQFTGSGTASTYDLTAAGKALLDDADVATQRLTLGLGSIATHSLSSVLALMQQKIPQINARTERILKTGLGTAANYDLSSLLGLLGEPRLPNYISSTTRDILKSGLGTISTHSLSSVLSMMATQVPSYLQHLDSASVSILKSGLGSIATHSLSSVLALMSQQKTLLDLKDTDLTGVATNDIIVHNGIKWVNQAPATARLSLGLGTVATHSLSSVLSMAAGSASAKYSPATKDILNAGLGTIATHSLSSVLALMSSTVSFSGLKDIDITAVADNDILVHDGVKWINETPATARTSLGLAIGSDVQAYDAELAAIAGLTSAADKGIQFTGSGTASTYDLTAAGKALLDDADAAAQRTTLGIAIGSDVQAYDAELAAIAGLTSAADKGIQFTGSGTASTYDLTAAGKALLDDVDVAAQRQTLGLGTVATHSLSSVLALASNQNSYGDKTEKILKKGLGTIASKDFATVMMAFDHRTSLKGLSDTVIDSATLADNDFLIFNSADSKWYNRDAATSRTKMGLAIGSDVQAYDAELAAIAGLTSAADKGIQFTGSGTASTYDLTAAGKALLDDADAAAQRITLGLGTTDSPSFVSVSATGTGSLKVPVGTTAQQTGSQGGIRYNTTDSAFEGYDGSAWGALGGGGAPAEQISDAAASTATLTGTYTETMMIADTFNVSGTVTLAAGFYMSKITDDGQPVIISGSGTLTGTGTMASRFPFAADSPKVNRKNLGLGHQGDGIATRSLSTAMMLGQSWGAITNRTLPATVTDFVSAASGGTFGGNISASNLSGTNTGDQTLPTDFISAASGGTFGGNIAASNLSGTNTGDQTLPTDFVSQASGGTFGGNISASNLSGTNTGDQTLPTDFVSKASGGTFLGNIAASNLSGTNTGDQTLPTDFVSKASGGTFSGNISASNLSGTNTGDQTLPTDFVSQASGGTFGGGIIATSFNGTEIVAGTNSNLGVGITTLNSLTSGHSNVGAGDNALTSCTDGYSHTAVGMYAMESTSSSNQNAAVGYCALRLNQTGERNTAMGAKTLRSLATGDFNTAVGYYALYLTNGANWNTAVGFDAGKSIVGGHKNTILGAKAGDNITTGSSNIMIGYDVDADSATGSNQLNIGNTIYADLSNVCVGIGTGWVPNSAKLQVITSNSTVPFKIGSNTNQTQELFRMGYGSNVALQGHISSGDGIFNVLNASSQVKVQLKANGDSFFSANILPAVDNTQNLGSGSKRWATMYGRATSANWSDLAEKYEADKYYDEGTVLAIGGEKEVTEYVKGMPFAGVVSIKPGLRMNDKEEYEDNPNYPYICLKGRIPVKINGTAKKGDYIIADDMGKGKSVGIQPQDMYNLIGISLEDGENIIEVKV